MDKKTREEVLTVLRTSDDLLRDFRNKIENKNVIIFVGNTRNGKSTLVNYITNVPLIAFKESNRYKIEKENSRSSGATIGHGTLSHTAVPIIIEMVGKPDTLIIDAPGFDDNRGVVQEIINALYINQVKYAKGVRFVLVTDFNNIITDNINYFLNFIDTVHTIMPDFLKLKEAVSIIFTKDWRDYNQTDIVKLLQSKILNEKNMRCNKELIQHFVQRGDLIGLFKMPTRPGLLSDEVDVNIHGAIFESLPINLNSSDIKFGISKSASVFLLETYLDFFDIVTFAESLFNDFNMTVSNKLVCFTRENLINTSQEVLGKIEIIKHEIGRFDLIIQSFNRQLLTSILNIPEFLKLVFIKELDKFCSRLAQIGLSLPIEFYIEDPFAVINELYRKLEYISLIEKVVEKNDKSNNILFSCKSIIGALRQNLNNMLTNLSKELEIRNDLERSLTSLPNIEPVLEEANSRYLFASSYEELLNMQKELQFCLHASNRIFENISKRPIFQSYLRNEIRLASLVQSTIKNKVNDINGYLERRNKEVVLKSIPSSIKGLLGMSMVTAGSVLLRGLNTTNQIFVSASSILLFAIFTWKSIWMRRKLKRIKCRYSQNRLFTRVTKLDDCHRIFLNMDY